MFCVGIFCKRLGLSVKM